MMRQEEMDKLLEKYEHGLCNAEETKIVESFLAEAEDAFIPGYSEFIAGQRAIESPASVMHFVEEDNIDALLLEQEANIDDLYTDFIAEERTIDCPVDVSWVIAGHEGKLTDILEHDTLLQDASYSSYISQEKAITCDIDVMDVIAKHEANIDGYLVEQEANQDSLYRSFIEHERNIRCDIDVLEVIGEKEAKVVPMRRTTGWRQMAGIAAIFITVLCAVFLLRTSIDTPPSMAGNMTEQERIEAEEALEYTLAALGMTKHKMDIGTQNLKILRELEHTNIYK